MAAPNICNICCKRVQSHSYHIRCNMCQHDIHLKCLPMVDKNDSIYIERHLNDWYCTNCIGNILPFNWIIEDEDFLLNLFEIQSKECSVPLEFLLDEDKIFSPFELNENENSPLYDVDPDIQFYNNQYNSILQSCDYYLEDYHKD